MKRYRTPRGLIVCIMLASLGLSGCHAVNMPLACRDCQTEAAQPPKPWLEDKDILKAVDLARGLL